MFCICLVFFWLWFRYTEVVKIWHIFCEWKATNGWTKHRTLLLKVGDFFGILRHAILCTTETYLWKTLDKKTRGRNCSKGFSAFVYLSDFSAFFCYFCMTETTNESRTNHNIKCVAKWGKFLGFSALYHQHIGHLMLPLNSVFVLFTKPTH